MVSEPTRIHKTVCSESSLSTTGALVGVVEVAALRDMSGCKRVTHTEVGLNKNRNGLSVFVMTLSVIFKKK